MKKPDSAKPSPPSLTLAQAINTYLDEAKSDSLLPALAAPLAKSTLKSWTSWLNRLARYLGPEAGISDFTADNLRRMLHSIAHLRPRTRRNAIFAWRAFGRWLVAAGHLSTKPAEELRIPRLDVAQRARCSEEMLSALLAACLRIFDPRRSALAHAIVRTFAHEGIRRTALLNLRVRDVNLREKKLTLNFGKGGRSREIPLAEAACAAIRAWLALRGECTHDFLFDFDHSRRIGDEGLRTILREVAAIAGYKDDEGALPHAIRHCFATKLLHDSGDVDAVRKVLGHASITTTAIYLHTEEDRMREVLELVSYVHEDQKTQREEKRERTGESGFRQARWRRERKG